MNFNNFLTEQSKKVKLTPIVSPDFNFIITTHTMEGVKKDPSLWVYEVKPLREADEIYGNFRRMDHLKAHIAIEDKNVEWEVYNVCNHAMATLYMRHSDSVLDGYLKDDNIHDYDIHYMVEGDSEIIEDMGEAFYLNGSNRIYGEEPFLRNCLLGKYNVMSQDTFDTFKGLYESTEDKDYNFNFKVLDTFNYDDYPDNIRNDAPNSIPKNHYFLVEYKHIITSDQTIYKKGVMHIMDMEYGYKGRPLDMVRGKTGNLYLYGEGVSDEDITKWWKEHIFSKQMGMYGLYPSVIIRRKMKNVFETPDNDERYNSIPVGYFDYCEIQNRYENARGKIAENFRDFVNHYFVDYFNKVGKLKISTAVSSKTADIFGGLYESFTVDNFEILAIEYLNDNIQGSIRDYHRLITVFKYKDGRYVMITKTDSTYDWNVNPPKVTTNYNNRGLVYLFKDDIPELKGEAYGIELNELNVNSHLKDLFGTQSPRFMGLVEFFGNRSGNSKIQIGERAKHYFIKERYVGSVFLTYLFDFIKKNLSTEKDVKRMIERAGLSDVAGDDTIDIFGGLYESNK
jgi:hypothetical protein